MEMSLRQYLEDLGWGIRFLDKWGNNARIGVINNPKHCMEPYRPFFRNRTSCFEPFSHFQRIFTNKRLPISAVISEGTEIRFLKSLKHELFGGGPIWWRMALSILEKFAHEDLSKKSIFTGYIEEQYRFDKFPFDEWLTVAVVRDFEAVYQEHDGQLWTIQHIALTYITQVEIRSPPTRLMRLIGSVDADKHHEQ